MNGETPPTPQTPNTPQTIGAALHKATSFIDQLDAELLLAHVIGESRAHIMAHGDAPLPPEGIIQYDQLIEDRAGGKPLAYITGEREFMSLTFAVDERVLIPRPETELLVEHTLEWLQNQTFTHPPLIGEIGTGSACISCSIAINRPDARLVTTDISEEALELATTNARKLKVDDRITFLHGDGCEPIQENGFDQEFDALISNPPYIGLDERAGLQVEVVSFEPEAALFDKGPEGLDITRRIIEDARAHVREGGLVAVEIGAGRGDAVRALFRECGYDRITTTRDLAGHDRVISGEVGPWPKS